MQNLHQPASGGNILGCPFSGLPLFDWAASVKRPMPRAIRVLTGRYGMTEPMASVVAELSGFGGLNHE